MLIPQWPESPKRILCQKGAEAKIRTKEETVQHKINQVQIQKSNLNVPKEVWGELLESGTNFISVACRVAENLILFKCKHTICKT